MSKKRITYIHIFIWLFALFANLPYANIKQGVPPEAIVSNIIGFLYLMVVFYLFYLVMVPYFLYRKKIIEFFILSFFVVLIMPFFGYTILFTARAWFEGTLHNFYRDYSLKMHMSGYYPVLTAAIFGSFFSVILNWFSTMNQKAELDKQKLAVELDLLKSKLNPHFLFNSLNSISSLTITDPAKAQEIFQAQLQPRIIGEEGRRSNARSLVDEWIRFSSHHETKSQLIIATEAAMSVFTNA